MSDLFSNLTEEEKNILRLKLGGKRELTAFEERFLKTLNLSESAEEQVRNVWQKNSKEAKPPSKMFFKGQIFFTAIVCFFLLMNVIVDHNFIYFGTQGIVYLLWIFYVIFAIPALIILYYRIFKIYRLDKDIYNEFLIMPTLIQESFPPPEKILLAILAPLLVLVCVVLNNYLITCIALIYSCTLMFISIFTIRYLVIKRLKSL